jgi:lipid-binding SYLF domain-containing protein
MAQYRHLPVWKAALDLAVHLEHAVRRFSRYNKYTLGSDLRQTAQRLCRLVARANDAKDAARLCALDELVSAVEEMKTLLTLAQEIKAFANFNEFAAATELTVSLGKQSGGWRRGVRPVAPSRQQG